MRWNCATLVLPLFISMFTIDLFSTYLLISMIWSEVEITRFYYHHQLILLDGGFVFVDFLGRRLDSA